MTDTEYVNWFRASRQNVSKSFRQSHITMIIQEPLRQVSENIFGLFSLIGPVQWAIWRARRWYRKSRRFTLAQLFFAFTIATLVIGAFSLVWNM